MPATSPPLPSDIDVTPDIDGVRYTLPPPLEHQSRRSVGGMLIMLGAAETVVVGGILLGVIVTRGFSGSNLLVMLCVIVGIVLLGAAVALLGAWLRSARTEIATEREHLRVRTRLGPIRRSRRLRLDRVEKIHVVDEPPTGLASAPQRRGEPARFVRLCVELRNGRRHTLASGLSRRLAEPLAGELESALGL
ncbi:MAG: hypothetical protein EA379_12600 [Phycisphaerales bacterium]|nr:MAG: hypothetical protein EA379_12600 [Phycisphaerales bacterium]